MISLVEIFIWKGEFRFMVTVGHYNLCQITKKDKTSCLCMNMYDVHKEKEGKNKEIKAASTSYLPTAAHIMIYDANYVRVDQRPSNISAIQEMFGKTLFVLYVTKSLSSDKYRKSSPYNHN
uniref:Uncharacterized protein n=1 Tax=Micrurus corallinus TaxID=54390 RepID=A0A2D4EXK6_MICCO